MKWSLHVVLGHVIGRKSCALVGFSFFGVTTVCPWSIQTGTILTVLLSLLLITLVMTIANEWWIGDRSHCQWLVILFKPGDNQFFFFLKPLLTMWSVTTIGVSCCSGLGDLSGSRLSNTPSALPKSSSCLCCQTGIQKSSKSSFCKELISFFSAFSKSWHCRMSVSVWHDRIVLKCSWNFPWSFFFCVFNFILSSSFHPSLLSIWTFFGFSVTSSFTLILPSISLLVHVLFFLILFSLRFCCCLFFLLPP